MSHQMQPRHRRRGPNDLQQRIIAAVMIVLGLMAGVLWATQDGPDTGQRDMLTPTQISQLRQQRVDRIQVEEPDAVHAATWNRADSQQAR